MNANTRQMNRIYGIQAEYATACTAEIDREDDILAAAINSDQWSQFAIQVRDHRDANGATHSISCHRNH